ncbi:hypothetical protein [Erythrobacter sp. F6033]|uniref:hypothetical protein n=1 Tax=Erythrobacter sp. F6033 TaxID=2926401 RepID=UPI001FF577E5|nr:hypothetical protein [Erythrobacter sp. F6033]MCK0127233.1 hypothetical protein [Erythrobacter sp. F6033]
MADTASPLPDENGVDEKALWPPWFRREQLGTRAASLTIAILVEALLILLLFMIGWNWREETDMAETVTTLEASDFTEDTTEPEAQPDAPSEARPSPLEPTPVEPQPEPVPLPETPLPVPNPLTNEPVPVPPITPEPTSAPNPPQNTAPAGPPARTYGPPNTGTSRGGSDSQRVGTAPNGEPLYAARWYREPTRQELAGYLSTADNPSTALIACRTVPDFYVDDCELIGESPRGSQIGRAVLAAAWQFRVRPARVGGRSQVGSWVRIRIDYTRAVRQ